MLRRGKGRELGMSRAGMSLEGLLEMSWDSRYVEDVLGLGVLATILPELGGTWREYNYDGNSKKGTRANNESEDETIGKGRSSGKRYTGEKSWFGFGMR